MKFAITGGREYDDRATVVRVLEGLPKNAIMVNGDARGADALAKQVWTQWGREIELYPADWDKIGRGAGLARNKQMLESGIDLLIAFPGGRGTANMTGICVAAGIPVVQVGDAVEWFNNMVKPAIATMLFEELSKDDCETV